MAVLSANMPESYAFNRGKLDHKLTDPKERILKVLNGFPEGATPKIVSFYSKLPHNTVKSYLRQLTEIGLVVRVYRGMYIVANRVHSMPSPKVQNGVLSCLIPDGYECVRVSDSCSFGHLKCVFGIGGKSRKATLHFSCEPPVEPLVVSILGKFFCEFIFKHTDFTPSVEDVSLTTIETNWDFIGVRLDGVSCITLKSYGGIVEKWYNKSKGLRHENKLSVPLFLKDFEKLFSSASMFDSMTGGIECVNQRLDQQELALSNQGRVLKALGRRSFMV